MRSLVILLSVVAFACQRSDRARRDHERDDGAHESVEAPVIESPTPKPVPAAKARFEGEIRDRLARVFVTVRELDAAHDPELAENVDVIEQRRLEIARELDRVVANPASTLRELEAIERSVRQVELDAAELRREMSARNDHSAEPPKFRSERR